MVLGQPPVWRPQPCLITPCHPHQRPLLWWLSIKVWWCCISFARTALVFWTTWKRSTMKKSSKLDFFFISYSRKSLIFLKSEFLDLRNCPPLIFSSDSLCNFVSFHIFFFRYYISKEENWERLPSNYPVIFLIKSSLPEFFQVIT